MTKLFYRGFSDADISIFEESLEKILANLAEYEKNDERRIFAFHQYFWYKTFLARVGDDVERAPGAP
jgi:hypothetical protein